MDRLCDAIHRIDLNGKRNIIASVVAGVLFATGWWIAIDAACAYPSNDELLKASHVCGALATVAFIMINSVTNNQIRGESMYGNDGCFGTVTARVWIFIAFLINFGSLISSIWIFVAHYVNVPERSNWPGVSILFQNIFIFISTYVFKFGRSENQWGN